MDQKQERKVEEEAISEQEERILRRLHAHGEAVVHTKMGFELDRGEFLCGTVEMTGLVRKGFAESTRLPNGHNQYWLSQQGVDLVEGSLEQSIEPGNVPVTPIIEFKQDGGTYGLASGYLFWSVFVDGKRVDFGGSLSTPDARRKFLDKYYPGVTATEVSRESLLEDAGLDRKVDVPHKLQRGDIVDVVMSDGEFTYRGVVRSASKKDGVCVITRTSGYTYPPETTSKLELVERHGLMPFSRIYELAQNYPKANGEAVTSEKRKPHRGPSNKM